VEGGCLTYAGSAGRVVVRPPQSVLERIVKFGLEDNSQWDITSECQLKYMHEGSQTWTWSKGKLRFVYEFGETNVMNVDRPFWPMNIQEPGDYRDPELAP
jgi:hypothetical protein